MNTYFAQEGKSREIEFKPRSLSDCLLLPTVLRPRMHMLGSASFYPEFVFAQGGYVEEFVVI